MIQEKLHTNKTALYEYILLAIIIFVGSVLRFWDYQNIPFMHDEFSALGRLRFGNFIELINKGVLPDGHPAGVQVFLYYWTALVGTSEPLVKLPFILSGILSIWLSYLIAKLWFDGITGLLTAVYISSLQFFVMYSQIARPYVSGLLLTLLLVYMWSLYFFKNRKLIYLILFVLFGTMAAYNHHFSLLFTAIVGVSGLFFIKKKERLVYLLTGVAIFILYIPHLNIFFSQLGYGGIGGIGGWLSKPTPMFFLKFANWTFHYSQLVWGAVVAVIMYLVLTNGSFAITDKGKQKRWLLLGWFMLPIVIGYLYSVIRNPIIQYSMLIFSTPYLFMLLFSYHKKIPVKNMLLLVPLLLIVNISTLVYGRDYYGIFYKQPYEQTIRTALVDNNADDVFLIDGGIPYYNEYYFNKYRKSVPYFSNADNNISLVDFEHIISNIKESRVVASSLTGEQLQIVQLYFPFQIGFDYGFTYEIYTFSKNEPISEPAIKRELIAQTNFESEIGNWKDINDMIEYDICWDGSYCLIPSANEWGPSIKFDLMDIAPKGLGIIDVELEISMPDTITKYLIVSSITEGKEVISWNALNFELFKPEVGSWRKVFFSVDIQHVLKSRKNVKGLVLKINIWNVSKNKLLINYINIYRKPGNPVRYGLYNEIYR
ncbi:MAG: glycosyltransferase family 39 protein [Bacteroidota bacterium]